LTGRKLIIVNGSDLASDSVDSVFSGFHSNKAVGSDSGCSLEGRYVMGAGSGKTTSFSDGSNGIRAWQRDSKKNVMVTLTASRAIFFCGG
jgi:hypothetical protein